MNMLTSNKKKAQDKPDLTTSHEVVAFIIGNSLVLLMFILALVVFTGIKHL